VSDTSAAVDVEAQEDARLTAELERLKAKYGKTLTKAMIAKKLATKRRYFDSAEYFQAVAEQQLGAGQAPSTAADAQALPTPVLHLFKRAPEGFVKHTTLPITSILAPSSAAASSNEASTASTIAARQTARKYWDSADWSLSLQGFLEFPIGEKPHPVMLLFRPDPDNRDGDSAGLSVGIAAHPQLGSSADVAMSEICEQAEAELLKRYGAKLANMRNSPAQRLKLKLRAKKKDFDSADWALELQGAHDTQ
jgi:hypothetical protein